MQAIELLGRELEGTDVKFAQALANPAFRKAVLTAMKDEAAYRDRVDHACDEFLKTGRWSNHSDLVDTVLIKARIWAAQHEALRQCQELNKGRDLPPADLLIFLRSLLIEHWRNAGATNWISSQWMRDVLTAIGE